MSRIPIAPPRIPTFDSRRVIPAPKQRAHHYGTDQHREWRSRVLLRAGYTCELCGAEDVSLHADHIVEINDGGDPLALSNGQALCQRCHNRKTTEEKKRRMLRG
jgi:5-methylcytosine-specific restriction protein A